MRHGTLLARRVKPSSWAHAARLSHAPRQDLLRPWTLQAPISGQPRFLQSMSNSGHLDRPAQNDQLSENGTKNESVKESSQSAELDSKKESSPPKPVRDYSWVSAYTGDRIEPINGKALQGTEEYVTHHSGTKLLCSWNVGAGNERAIWVPGDAPRVRDLKLPVDLSLEMVPEAPSSDWTLGNPHASFEPFFASLASMNPQANFDSTDVIAHAGTLTLLLGVARGNLKQVGASNTAVVFHIVLVENTLIIKRIQNTTKGAALGKGLTPTLTGGFMNRITEMKASGDNINPAHFQAVRYDLAHLRCVAITPVDAATGHASLPPLTAPNKPLKIPKGPESVKVNMGGCGVSPAAVTKVMTGYIVSDPNKRRLNNKGQLKIKPSGQAKIWFTRPKTILQGHLEPTSPEAPEGTARLARVSVRETEAILDQVEEACQLELRILVSLLERLRNIARKAGGSCILTGLPAQNSESKNAQVPPRFDIYKCGPGAERVVLDWHVERFWSKK